MKIKRVLVFLLELLVLLLLIIGTAVFVFLNSKLNKVNFEGRDTAEQAVVHVEEGEESSDESSVESPSDSSETGITITPKREQSREKTEEESGVTNIMLIGVDNDYYDGMNDRGNADGLILVSINKDTREIIMSSIMRDIAIRIPDKGRTKVTLVYHDYGTDALLDTIETNFDVYIDNYVLVNYYNVMDIIDAMGGLDIELTASEIYGMESKINNLNKLTGDPVGTDVLRQDQEGMNHLNGKQVAALLRIRNTGNNDYGRTARAREVLSLMMDKALHMSLGELNNLSDVIMHNITTDMTPSNMMSLLFKAPGYLRYDLVSNRIPIDGTSTSDGSFNYIDYPANVEALREIIYG